MKQKISFLNQEVASIPSPVYNANLSLSPKFYTIHQAAFLLGYSSITLRNWISQGKCPFETVRRGGKRLVVISSFNDFLDGVTTNDDAVISHTFDLDSSKKRPRGRPRKLANKELTKSSNV